MMSFYHWPMFGERSFVGLKNYAALLGSPRFRQAVIATVTYGLQIPLQLVLGTIMALIVKHTKRFTTVLGMIFLLPYIIPPQSALLSPGIYCILLSESSSAS